MVERTRKEAHATDQTGICEACDAEVPVDELAHAPNAGGCEDAKFCAKCRGDA